jgi:hypothetical protein
MTCKDGRIIPQYDPCADTTEFIMGGQFFSYVIQHLCCDMCESCDDLSCADSAPCNVY